MVYCQQKRFSLRLTLSKPKVELIHRIEGAIWQMAERRTWGYHGVDFKWEVNGNIAASFFYVDAGGSRGGNGSVSIPREMLEAILNDRRFIDSLKKVSDDPFEVIASIQRELDASRPRTKG